MALKLMNLLPREEKFYEMIDELSRYANDTALLLDRLVSLEDEKERIFCGQQIASDKAAAKKVYETLNTEVCRTFVTPFDREDIQAFALLLYAIPKMIDKVQDRMIRHKLSDRNEDFKRFASIIKQQSQAMTVTIKILNNGRKLEKMCESAASIDNLEDQGDQLLGQLIEEVFWNVQDTRELILRKDIYEMLEDVTDYYRDCANVALQIILKHS